MSSFAKKKGNRKRKRWRNFLITIFILILAGYIYREQLQRAVIAIVISRENIFTPPSQISSESFVHRFWNKAQFYYDVSELRVARDRRLKQFNPDS